MTPFKNRLRKILLLTLIGLPLSIFAQLQSYSFTKIDSLQQNEKKNIVAFIHTDWCKYCQVMKNTTYKDEKVVALLNEHFWFADLNAEAKQDITFNGHTFKYQPNGHHTGIHELAKELGSMDGKIAYPALCILNADHEIIFQYNQFLSSDDLLKVLNAVLEQS